MRLQTQSILLLLYELAIAFVLLQLIIVLWLWGIVYDIYNMCGGDTYKHNAIEMQSSKVFPMKQASTNEQQHSTDHKPT